MVNIAAGKARALERFLDALVHDYKFEEFVHELLLAILKSVQCEAGSVFEVDYNNNAVFSRTAVGGRAENISNFTIPIGKGIVGHVIESKQPLVVENVPENSVHLSTIAKAVGFDVRNLAAFPVLIRGRVFGVIELLNKVGEPDFGAGDIELLTYLTQMASKAIEVRLMLAWEKQEQSSAEQTSEGMGRAA